MLRAACNGLPYAADLAATGGEPPYTWALGQSSFGLELSPAGHLSGEPIGAGERQLSITVRDSLGAEGARTVSLDVRERCGFAYISRETGPLRLWVVDTMLHSRSSFPTNPAETDQVFDFEFSPDGRYLAFRAGPDEESTRLHLLLVEGESDRVVPFERPVRDYAWSKSSQYLAVVLASEEIDRHFLSGIDVEATDQIWGEHPVTYRTELQWLDDSAVVFQGQAVLEVPGDPPVFFPVPDRESPYVAARIDGGLVSPRQLAAIQETAAHLYATPSGIMTSAEGYPGIQHVVLGALPQDDIPSIFDHTTPMIWSEDRTFLARIDDAKNVEIFSLTQALSPLAIGDSRCDALLARRTLADRERLICLDDEATGCSPGAGLSGSIRITDFFRASNAFVDRTVSGCYQASRAQANPRTISRDGAWFVFDVGSNFSVAGLDDLSVRHASLLPAGDDRAYAIAPDSTRLLWQLGGRLSVQTLKPAGDHVAISAPNRLARPPEPCVDAFLDSDVSWCGNGNLTHAHWSTDSSSIAYESDSGVLWMADVSVIDAPAVVQQVTSSATCPNGCVITYAFQPSP